MGVDIDRRVVSQFVGPPCLVTSRRRPPGQHRGLARWLNEGPPHKAKAPFPGCPPITVIAETVTAPLFSSLCMKVKLALQGACGSCPSSTTTMKMGIERVLNENFLNMGGVREPGLSTFRVLRCGMPCLAFLVSSIRGEAHAVIRGNNQGAASLRSRR